MVRILFVCYGNICRSPMAEFVLRDMAEKAQFPLQVASAGTSAEELGNPVYPPVQKLLAAQGIDAHAKRARRLTRADYKAYDLLIAMDEDNLRSMRRLMGDDPAGKLRLLLAYAGRPGESVADPWYTRDFDATWRDVQAGCKGLLENLQAEA